MSLNRYEQALHDYILSIPEEETYWRNRVCDAERGASRREQATLDINAELWSYFEERAQHERQLADVLAVGSGKVSMLNLAEYLLRVWVPVLPPKPK